MTLVATSSRTDFAVSRDVRRAFTRSASRFLPAAEDVVSQAAGLFEVCATTFAGLEKRYLSFPVWPWDGQVSLLLMGWVMGPGFKLEKFQLASQRYAPDFREMSRQCVFPHRGHTGVMALGDRCREGFEAAADAIAENKNRKTLYCHW
jgi:hypothetical protein